MARREYSIRHCINDEYQVGYWLPHSGRDVRGMFVIQGYASPRDRAIKMRDTFQADEDERFQKEGV